MTFDVYEMMKSFTAFVLETDQHFQFINYPFSFFLNNIRVGDFLALTRKMVLQEPLRAVKKNGFLSGLIFMIYLKVKSEIEEEEEKRMLIQSMMGMNAFESGLRLELRKMLTLKCKLVRKVEGRRRKRIWCIEKGGKRVEKMRPKVEKMRVRPYVK